MEQMIKQLKEVSEMQKALDERILKEKGIVKYPLENMKIALFVELGELMNELPTKFKHWKSSAADNHEKAVEEYVDCLHFAISIFNYRFYGTEASHEILESCCKDFYEVHPKLPISVIVEYILSSGCELSYLFILGRTLCFTWKEIYEAYKKKNEVNYQRLKSGY